MSAIRWTAIPMDRWECLLQIFTFVEESADWRVKISKSLITGKVRGIVWPLEKVGWIRWQDYRMSSRIIPGKIEEPVQMH